MKFRAVIILALLFVLNTSHASEFLFSFNSDSACSTTQHSDEFKVKKNNTNEHCELHCEYHSSYLLPQYNFISKVAITNSSLILKQNLYVFQNKLEFFKPPIS
ncbi:MAG: hypothetical protein L3I99_01595 [Sulfurimonas sp.]|nr:hypothetical protein [Sulfurimonas sp.]